MTSEKPSPRLKGTLINQATIPPVEKVDTSRLKGRLVTERRVSSATGAAALGGSKLRGSLIERRTTPESGLPPTFTEMRPEPKAVKTYKSGNVELRQSSTSSHQDGVAHNPETKTTALSDGMGGVGRPGDVKNTFAFALAHAAAELEDVSTLRNPEVVGSVVERSKELLAGMGIVPEGASGFRGGIGAGRNVAWGATLAIAQEVPGEEGVWRMAIFGDTSVVKLGSDGKIKEGYGEVFQLFRRGEVNPDGSAKEQPLGSYVGMAKDTFEGVAQYEDDGLGAVFGTVQVAPGEKLVLVSDAYLQKSSPATLEADAMLTNEQWAAKAPMYSDDTTMAVITGA